jgi:long-subunit acyl-CoA synthetase (AMP-forming)
VAVGGAPVASRIADAAWTLGIPVYEGYGLSECCSVVSVNRIGDRRPGTVGRPLDGLRITIDQGEIVIDGPSITDGYLGRGPADRPWRTGDLGEMDHDGFLTVHGRKDDLIVTALGRNVSPEWVETMLLGDGRIAFCAVTGRGEPHLTALLIPSRAGAAWFDAASDEDVSHLIARCCSAAPAYATPGNHIIATMEEAVAKQILSPNGRILRAAAEKFVRERRASDKTTVHKVPESRSQDVLL